MARKTRGSEAAETVRAAVDKTFQATAGQAQTTRDRAQEIVDEVVQATSRVRDSLDDMRLATGEDVRELRRELRSLSRRLDALEKKPKPKAASRPRPTTKSRASAARKVAKGRNA